MILLERHRRLKLRKVSDLFVALTVLLTDFDVLGCTTVTGGHLTLVNFTPIRSDCVRHSHFVYDLKFLIRVLLFLTFHTALSKNITCI